MIDKWQKMAHFISTFHHSTFADTSISGGGKKVKFSPYLFTANLHRIIFDSLVLKAPVTTLFT